MTINQTVILRILEIVNILFQTEELLSISSIFYLFVQFWRSNELVREPHGKSKKNPFMSRPSPFVPTDLECQQLIKELVNYFINLFTFFLLDHKPPDDH